MNRTMTADLLAPLFGAAPPPFALVRREGRDTVDLLLGDLLDVEHLDDIPLPGDGPAPGREVHDVLALVPFRQIRERGFEALDDGAPLRCLVVTGQFELPVADVLAALPDVPVELSGGGFDVDDETYAAIVKRVITDEIGQGEGANFVVRRDFRATVAGHVPAVAGTLLRRLLTGESGAYWTYLVHAGDRTMVGASPERHVSAIGGEVVMNPISGTYRYPATGPDPDGLVAFLGDTKEIDELFMVVDEELKMMSEVCDLGGAVEGPFLKEMGHLAHTEYVLRGRTSLDVRAVLRGTMFAPTVTGSPLENACRVIRRHETSGRGHYSGVLALLGRDAGGRRTLDAPILIRTAHLTPDGDLRVPAGATLVRHSRPADEVAETLAKASGVLAALGVVPGPARRTGTGGNTSATANPGTNAGGTPDTNDGGTPATNPGPAPRLADDPRVAGLLAARNASLAPFWLTPRDDSSLRDPRLTGRQVLVVDAEDTFTAMLAHVLRSLGPDVRVLRYDHVTAADLDAADLVVMGPGPGDPRRATGRIGAMRALVRARLEAARPLFAVCLGHQVLCAELGLALVRKDLPHQGKQMAIDLFGARETAGFYNTFAALRGDGLPGADIAADPATGEIHALRMPARRIAGVQFHPESVLTTRGIDIVRDLVGDILGP